MVKVITRKLKTEIDKLKCELKELKKALKLKKQNQATKTIACVENYVLTVQNQIKIYINFYNL